MRTTVPTIDDFISDSGYLEAPELKAIADRLIDERPLFGFIRELTITYLWKDEGGMSRGRAVMAKVQKTPKLMRHFVTSDFVVYLGADRHEGLTLDDPAVERSVFHELLHFYVTAKGKIQLHGHDHEYFDAEVARYGAAAVSGD